MDIDVVLADLRETYGSLRDPHFGVLTGRLEAGPDAGLLRTLRGRFEVADDTDLNEDHGWNLLLTAGGRQWALRISAVGRYAAFARISRAWDAVLTADPAGLSPDESWAVGVLTGHGLQLLGEAELETPVPLTLTGAEGVRVYQALFTDTDILPWDHATLRRLGLLAQDLPA